MCSESAITVLPKVKAISSFPARYDDMLLPCGDPGQPLATRDHGERNLTLVTMECYTYLALVHVVQLVRMH